MKENYQSNPLIKSQESANYSLLFFMKININQQLREMTLKMTFAEFLAVMYRIFLVI